MAAGLNKSIMLPETSNGENDMVPGNVYKSNGSAHDTASEFPASRPFDSGVNNDTVSDTNAGDLNSRELQSRLDVIRGLYKTETSLDGRKRYRKEARRIKQAMGRKSRKMSYLGASLVITIVLLMFFLQNIGLIL